MANATGGVDNGEDYITAMKRELIEETVSVVLKL